MEESPMPVPTAKSVSIIDTIITHRSDTTLLILRDSLRVLLVRRIRVADRDDGQDSGLLQTPGLRVPELGDLRRHTFLLRLRTFGRRAEKKHERGVVAPHRTHARRRRGAGCGHHHASEGLGGLRSRGRLQRHARREPHVEASLPGRSPHRSGYGDGGRGPLSRGTYG